MSADSDSTQSSEEPSFYWWYEDVDKPVPLTFHSCAQISFGIGSNPNISTPATPPYTFIVYPAGQPARTYPVDQIDDIPWTVDLPEGTTALFQFVDSKGRSGGISPFTTITSNSNSSTDCLDSTNPQQDSTLTFSYSPKAPATCEEVQIQVQGGDPPYTWTVVRAGTTGVNISDFESEATWTNTLSAGAGALYAVSDSSGNYALIPEPIMGQGGDNTTCQSTSQSASAASADLTSTQSHQSSTNTASSKQSHTSGAVIGGAVAAAVLALFVGIGVGFLVFQKRRKQRNARASKRLTMPGLQMHQWPQQGYHHGSSTPPSRGSVPLRDRDGSIETHSPPRFNFRVLNPDPVSDTSTIAPDDVDQYSISSRRSTSPSINDAHQFWLHQNEREGEHRWPQEHGETLSVTSMPSTISSAQDTTATGYAHSRHPSTGEMSTAQKRRSYSLHSSASMSTISG